MANEQTKESECAFSNDKLKEHAGLSKWKYSK
jgi:hypothetical protein